MGLITALQPTAELDAVNLMLSAIGKSPLTTLAGTLSKDTTMAVNLLRTATRELQAKGWKFNTEFGYEIAPTAQLVWTDSSGASTTLNVFKPPASGLASWTTTPNGTTISWCPPDMSVRLSRVYREAGSAVQVFYDRRLNRDGFEATAYPFLYIDPIWFVDFEQMPESARYAATVIAGQKFIEHVLGSQTLAGFAVGDVQTAMKLLRDDQGLPSRYNIFNNADTLSILGLRRRRPSGLLTGRASPGPV